MEAININRARRKIDEAIELLNLDLSGINVLTEIGSNYFSFTAAICLAAGAKNVFAWTKDSRYGLAQDNITQSNALIETYGNQLKGKVHYRINEFVKQDIEQANIITNSGLLRPLNEKLLQYIDPTSCVVGLMYEAWEFRDADLDLEYCKTHNIRVTGVWENHPAIKVFSGTGKLAIKLALEAGLEVYQNKILVWSNDHFGEEATQAFKSFGASEVIMTIDVDLFYNHIATTDFVYLCKYDENKPYFGEEESSVFSIERIKTLNPSLNIVHLYGHIDIDTLKKNQLEAYPNKNGVASQMTFTLAYLGMTPLIRLYAGGLKSSEALLKSEENPLVQIL